MSALAIALIVLGCTCGAAVLGIRLRKLLPEHHFDSESKDLVKLVMGLVATISALVLALLIASASSSFNTQQDALQSVSIRRPPAPFSAASRERAALRGRIAQARDQAR